MKNYFKILIAFVGVLGLFTSCEKDGDQLVMRENVIAPTITTMPDLTLSREDGANELIFKCSPVDPGFNASVNYFLEASPAGNGFEDVVLLYNGVTCNEIKMTVNKLNSMLLDILPEDATSSAEFRIRAVLETDAGAGVEDWEYNSEPTTADATVFGLLRLDVMITGGAGTQKIVSSASDGNYEGYIKFEVGDSFTLSDPDNNITYGGSSGALVVDGSPISVEDGGWYKLTANTTDLTFENQQYLVGIVGNVNDWSAPDLVMDYDAEGKFWYRNGVAVPTGDIKFRHNEDWNNDFNFGVVDNSADLDFKNLELYNDGGSQNIPLTAGTYDFKLWINLDGSSKASIVPSK